MKKIFALLSIISLIATGGWMAYFLTFRSPQRAVIEFQKGTPLRTISQKLKKEKVIPSATLFELFTRLKGKGKLLRAGEYEFGEGSYALEVLLQMEAGKVKLYPFTIPEGFNLKEIGKMAALKGITTEEEWNQITRNKELIAALGVRAETLEGYLFPNTYLLQKNSSGGELTQAMLTLFKKKITTDHRRQAEEKGLSLHQWVTLASLIEKETGRASERPLIAAVFLNRLEKNMLLQTDPSVIYGIENFNSNLTKADLERDTPYNTYIRPGLPPGPICSPGMESLMSVLYPAPVNYLYFVSKGDGSHHFSTTLEEHNQAVSYYQLHSGLPP